MCPGDACVEREEVKKKETREMFLSTRSYDKEIRPMGSLVIQPCLGNQKKEEKNVKWRKGENIVFNIFADRVANFQRVNWMSNVH